MNVNAFSTVSLRLDSLLVFDGQDLGIVVVEDGVVGKWEVRSAADYSKAWLGLAWQKVTYILLSNYIPFLTMPSSTYEYIKK